MNKGVIEQKAGGMSSAEEMAETLKDMTADDFRLAYLDYVNNFLTTERFASYYGLTEDQASLIITTGRTIQDVYAGALRGLKG